MFCYECTPEQWTEFIKAMHSGEPFECDEEMFYYWLEVLPPVYMNRRVALPPPHGGIVNALFGFAEGAEHITAFWRTPAGDHFRYFGCRTDQINSL